MHRCLYDPVNGYYRRRNHNPFGSDGDFYTAVQITPVFGEVIAAYLDPLAPSVVIDLGAGRAGLSEYLNRWKYHAVDWDLDPLPDEVSGIILANEFFDALPVRLLRREGEHWMELMVDEKGCFVVSKTLDPALVEYVDRYGEVIPDGGSLEVNISLPEWLRRIANVLTSGRLLIIDYGYDAHELLRFPAGTLMRYRRHVASTDVLTEPGLSDLTAHVNFTEMKRAAAAEGLDLISESSLGAWVLRVFGEERLEGRSRSGGDQWRLQWKQLVFGLGETFRVLEFEAGCHTKKKASDLFGGLR